MSISRIFINWDTPLLPQVARRLVERFGRGDNIDLGSLIAVVPGGRAGRRLRELLVDETGGRHVPPRIITVGDLPELLYEPQRPFADELAQRLAWGRALQSLDPTELNLLIQRSPDENDAAGWLAFAELLWRQHRELAAEGLDFSEVVERGTAVAQFNEVQRWQVLAEVQRRYLGILDELQLWDKQTARLVAIEQQEFTTDSDIALIGTTDLTKTHRRILNAVADRVTAFIHAPESWSERFDEHGCVIAEAWQDVDIEYDPSQLVVADGPVEQADEIAFALANLNGQYRVDEVCIGLTIDALAPHVQRILSECGVSSRWAGGSPIVRTSPCRLLAAAAESLVDDHTEAFAAFVRHPDVSAWLVLQDAAPTWLSELDQFISDHIPVRLGRWLSSGRGPSGLREVHRQVNELLEPLRGPARPLGEWSPPLLEFLDRIYGEMTFSAEDSAGQAVIQACEQLEQVLTRHASIPGGLSPGLTAAGAIRLTLAELSSATLPPPYDPSAVDLLGWLEVPLDDAPAAILCGVNEGLIPDSVNADPFLPDRLRTELGLTDNARRYARDAHAFSALLHARSQVTLISGRRDARGDPLIPSRLLLAGSADRVADHVRDFYSRRPASGRPPLAGVLTATREASGFSVPRPTPDADAPDVIRVTSLRDYLASPYRYYLRHILKLSEADDGIEELSAGAFGNLVHEVLSRFGTSAARGSRDAREIRAFLKSELQAVVRESYGDSPSMAVEIQAAQAEMRLEAFSEWQANWSASGWEIRFTEQPDGSEGIDFRVDGNRTVQLVGRIDRIDFHPAARQWMVFDYKTGENADGPAKTHLSGDDWIDLQLPLYRHLAKTLGVDGDVQLAYLRLPRDTNAVSEQIAGWSADQLETADETARRVIASILDGQFWETLDNEPRTLSEYAPICQDGVFDREVTV